MTPREEALYRYLTMWADFTPAEARDAIHPHKAEFSPAQGLGDRIPSDAYTARWNTARTGAAA